MKEEDPLMRIREQAGPSQEDFDWMIDEIDRLRLEKNQAYSERNKVVAALAKLVVAISGDDHYKHLAAGVKTDLDAEPGWSTVVFIDYPTGQVSWHFSDEERHLLASLPFYKGEWDGHSTEEKYRRLGLDL